MGDRHGMAEGLFERVGRDADDVAGGKLRSLRRLVLLTFACEAWTVLGYVPYSSSAGVYGGVAALFTLCAILGWRDRYGSPALLVAALLELAVVVSVFPHNANHQFLAIVMAVLMLLVRPGASTGAADPGDARVCLQSVRWLVLVGVGWAGVMKLVSGHWLGGEFLSYRIAIDPGFARVFAPLLSDPELARLLSLENRVGAGPFRAAAPALVVVSNLTWVAELLLPLGLLFERTRAIALVGALGLMLAVQLGAREIFFAGLMVGGLLLFAERDRLRGALPAIGAAYAIWLLRAEIAALLGAGGGG